MQNENKHQSWKQKLEDTESLSAGLRFDKNAVWDKLQHRLQQKPKRRKAIWYWAAAACLLPLSLFLAGILHQPDNIPATEISNRRAWTKQGKNETKSAQKDTSVLAESIYPVKKKAVVKKKMSDNVAVAINKENEEKAAIDSVVSNKAETALVTNDSADKTPVAIQTKKKLKVVHINELGEPDEALPYAAHAAYLHSFPLQIAREETYLSPLKTTRPAGIINLKIMSLSN